MVVEGNAGSQQVNSSQLRSVHTDLHDAKTTVGIGMGPGETFGQTVASLLDDPKRCEGDADLFAPSGVAEVASQGDDDRPTHRAHGLEGVEESCGSKFGGDMITDSLRNSRLCQARYGGLRDDEHRRHLHRTASH